MNQLNFTFERIDYPLTVGVIHQGRLDFGEEVLPSQSTVPNDLIRAAVRNADGPDGLKRGGIHRIVFADSTERTIPVFHNRDLQESGRTWFVCLGVGEDALCIDAANEAEALDEAADVALERKWPVFLSNEDPRALEAELEGEAIRCGTADLLIRADEYSVREYVQAAAAS